MSSATLNITVCAQYYQRLHFSLVGGPFIYIMFYNTSLYKHVCQWDKCGSIKKTVVSSRLCSTCWKLHVTSGCIWPEPSISKSSVNEGAENNSRVTNWRNEVNGDDRTLLIYGSGLQRIGCIWLTSLQHVVPVTRCKLVDLLFLYNPSWGAELPVLTLEIQRGWRFEAVSSPVISC